MDFSTLLADFAAAFSQEQRMLTLRFADGAGIADDALLPDRLQGREQLSGNYRYELTCLSPDAGLELKHLQGQILEIGILQADDSRRHINGIVTKAQQQGSEGGFATYALTLEPALALLALRRNSRAFQDLSVPEIVSAILDEHRAANPVIQAAFKLDKQLEKDYPQRSYCLQYRESDLAFIERLLREEGISHTFTFSQDDNSPMHTLVLFDDVYRLPEQTQANIRFHRDASSEEADGITEWLGARQVTASMSGLASFDYQPVTTQMARAMTRIESGDAASQAQRTLEWYDPQTAYYGAGWDEMQRYAGLRQDARDMSAKLFQAASNVRGLGVGAWFQLDQHPVHDQDVPGAREFVVTEMDFEAVNNLVSSEPGTGSGNSQTASPLTAHRPLLTAQKPYQNRFKAVRRGIPIVPEYTAQHAKPSAQGRQSATVVGPVDEEIHTDDMGRIKLQFHWQRSQDHPQDTANLDDKSSTWVRVMYSWAGANWGCQQIPRVGQEVQVGFLENDIDRPMVMGVTHNGRHMPPTFSGAGALPANKTLSGIKTKEYRGNLYNELLMDDSTGETRIKLSSEHAKTQLNQGYLIHPRTEGRGEPRGEGFELRTDAAGALRAAKGLLVSTDARRNATGKQLDRPELLGQLHAATDLADTLGDNAAHQLANRTETGKDNQLIKDDKAPGNKSNTGHQHHVLDAIESLEKGSNTDKDSKSGNKDQAGGQAILALSAPAGIAIVTPNAATLTTGTNLDQVAQRDTSQTTARRWIHNVGESMSLYVSGSGNKIKETMKLIAAKGKFQMQAQSGEIELTADQAIQMTSISQEIKAAAAKDITMTSGGGYIKLGGGNIDIHAPGMVSIKCAKLVIEGAVSLTEVMPVFPSSVCKDCLLRAAEAGSPVAKKGS
jgi:type VI secretion system secreted protein VgrG